MSLLSHWLKRGSALRPEAVKTSLTGPLMAYYQTGRPIWTPRDYASLAKEGFQANAIVYRAVRMVAGPGYREEVVVANGSRATAGIPVQIPYPRAETCRCCLAGLLRIFRLYIRPYARLLSLAVRYLFYGAC